MRRYPDCPDCECDVFVEQMTTRAERFVCHVCERQFERSEVRR